MGLTDLPKRLQAKIIVNLATGCWDWQGAQGAGYGHTYNSRLKRMDCTHRVTYELLVGPIEGKLTVDHLCRNKMCCNPEHFELVSRSENVKRWAASYTHCKRGHEFTPENTYVKKTPRGDMRECRSCMRARDSARWPQRKEQRKARREVA